MLQEDTLPLGLAMAMWQSALGAQSPGLGLEGPLEAALLEGQGMAWQHHDHHHRIIREVLLLIYIYNPMDRGA